MMAVVLHCAVLMAVVVPALGGQSVTAVHDGVDITRDITCSPLANNTRIGQGDGCGSVAVASAEKCCSQCILNPCCLAFTYARGTCYFKNNTEGRCVIFLNFF
jgi:hypothetical protein